MAMHLSHSSTSAAASARRLRLANLILWPARLLAAADRGSLQLTGHADAEPRARAQAAQSSRTCASSNETRRSSQPRARRALISHAAGLASDAVARPRRALQGETQLRARRERASCRAARLPGSALRWRCRPLRAISH
jgi:hypothetical protein